MKRMVRTVALAMALVMALAAPAMAEAAVHAMTISNISIRQDAEEPTRLGLSVTLKAGGAGERGYLSLGAAGDGQSIADFEAAYEDGLITLALDGLANNYSIRRADLEALALAGMEQAADGGSMPFDPKALQDLVAGYFEAVAQAKAQGEVELTAEETADLYREMGFVRGADEEVTVNGRAMTLTRYDADLDAAAMDGLIAAALERTPAMKDYMNRYFAFLRDLMSASSDGGATFDPEHIFASLYGQMGADLRIVIALWTDVPGDNLRMEMTETIQVPADDEGGETMNVTVPMTMQVSTDGRGQRVAMDMNMDQQGVRVDMAFKLRDAMPASGAEGSFGFDMAVDGERASMTGDYRYGEDGAGALSGELNVPTEGGRIARVGLQVRSTGGDENTHSVQLRTVQLETEGAIAKELSRFTLAFDLTTSASALPEGALIGGGKEALDILTLTEEQQRLAAEALMTQGISAYGRLMQTEGVAKLLTEAIMVASEAFGTITTEITAEDAAA